MTIKFDVPTANFVLFHSPEVAFTYRGLTVEMCTTVQFDSESSPNFSMDFRINDGLVVDFPRGYLQDRKGDDLYGEFLCYVRCDELRDEWFTLLERALDNYIEVSGVLPDPKQGVARPTTLDVVIRLCAMTTELKGYANYEHGTLEDAFKLLHADGADMHEVLAVLKDGRAHAFRPGFIEDHPETWLVEACIRLLANL